MTNFFCDIALYEQFWKITWVSIYLYGFSNSSHYTTTLFQTTIYYWWLHKQKLFTPLFSLSKDKSEKTYDTVDTYSTGESTYLPHVWSKAPAALNRTTIVWESFHSHFNDSIYHTHSAIFIFVNKLIKVQAETYEI